MQSCRSAVIKITENKMRTAQQAAGKENLEVGEWITRTLA